MHICLIISLIQFQSLISDSYPINNFKTVYVFHNKLSGALNIHIYIHFSVCISIFKHMIDFVQKSVVILDWRFLNISTCRNLQIKICIFLQSDITTGFCRYKTFADFLQKIFTWDISRAKQRLLLIPSWMHSTI